MSKTTKRYSPESLARRVKLLAAIPFLLIGAALTQTRIDPLVKDLHKNEADLATASGGLNNEFLLLPLLGFREAAAGLLWVRCDEFFHSGDYDAILPLVRMITWLDPHADNVYVTGAWHLAYNFTDASERSDWRYIDPSQALLDEGIRNNMNIPDIKFEKGWQNYDKIKDYVTAEKAFKMAIAGPKGDEKATSKEADDYPYAAPLKTLHILAHTYERMGRIPEALEVWQRALKRSKEMMAASPTDFGNKQMNEAEKHNYAQNLQRYHDRYTTTEHEKAVNPTPYPAVIAPPPGPDTTPRPWNVSFSSQIDVTRPKVLKISGLSNFADGARVDLWISDWDYKPRPIGKTLNSFDVASDSTILHDSLSVRKTKFEREIDMSKDPKMYAFTQPFYRIVLSYNPRTSSPHLQDRYGWSGEGMTDKNPARLFIDTREEQMGTRLFENAGGSGPVWDGKTVPFPTHGQPLKLIKTVYKVSRDQMMGLKPITDADIVSNNS